MSLDYNAYCVSNGKLIDISTVHTRQTARSLVDYWEKSGHLADSFSCKKGNEPREYREQVKEYWREYDESHKCPVQEYDEDDLPW